MRLTFIIILTFIASLTRAQISQKGRVVEQNSGNKGLEQTSLLFRGAAPTTSDREGHFNMFYTKAGAGDPVVIIEIHKAGYEVVNAKELSCWSLSSTKELNIVMCRQGMLDQARRQYYKIGEDIYQKRYADKLAEIKALQASNKIGTDNFRQRLNEANEQLIRLLNNLDVLSDKFARINKDELSELDGKALKLFESGDIDGALKVYEDSGILDSFKENVALRDSIKDKQKLLISTMQKEAQILQKSSDSTNKQRADSIMKLMNNPQKQPCLRESRE